MPDFQGPTFPWEAFMQAQQQKARNTQLANEQFAGGLGSAGGGIVDVIKKKKTQQQEQQKKQAWGQTINQMMNDPNTPQQMKAILPMVAQKPELMGQLGPEILKLSAPPKTTNVWHPVPGMTSKAGKPLEINESTGEYREAPQEVKTTGGMGSAMAAERHTQFGINDLPSNQGPNTSAGAAYQVKVAARQGKAIIGKPGSPQQLALAASDLARAVQRSAPQLDTLQGAGFSNNLQTQLNMFTQKLTADPTGKDVPKIRKQIYDLLDDLDKTATPWVENQLDTLSEAGYPISSLQRKRQLGLTIPDVPFVGGLGEGQLTSGKPVKVGRFEVMVQ